MSKPIIVFGDFNLTIASNEKEGGSMCHLREIPIVRAVMEECGLKNLGFKGPKFTWQQCKREGGVVRERLTDLCAILSGDAEVNHFPIYLSDHVPIILNCCNHRKKKK